MSSDKIAAHTSSIPLYRETYFKLAQTDRSTMKKFKADFEVIKDEEGNLCAADKRQMIFTDGKDEAELVDNIRDAVECYFEVPYSDVEISIVYK